MLLEGLNRIRDLHYADVDKGQLGTDGTAASESQTGLVTAVGATKLAVTKQQSEKTNTFTYTLPSTTGTGSTYREFEIISDANSVDYNRITFTGIAHTVNDDLVFTQTISYLNPD